MTDAAQTSRTPASSSHRGRWIALAAGVALVAVMGLSTTFVSSETANAGSPDAFDPATFAADTYGSEIVPAITDGAIDVATLADALADDPDAAGEQFGQRDGNSPYTYAVSVTGVAGEPTGSLLPIEVEGLDDVRVSIQIGPINGTALRDVTGTITFNDFVNQVDYADAAIALNQEMVTSLLADIDPASLEGKTITVLGAAAPLAPDLITLTAVSIEVAP